MSKEKAFQKNPRPGRNTNNDTYLYFHGCSAQHTTTQEDNETTTPPAAATAVVVVLGSCSAAYVVLVLPLFCELSTIQVRKELLIYDDRHAFSSIPESLCLKEISLYLYHRASDYYTSSYILRIQIHRDDV